MGAKHRGNRRCDLCRLLHPAKHHPKKSTNALVQTQHAREWAAKISICVMHWQVRGSLHAPPRSDFLLALAGGGINRDSRLTPPRLLAAPCTPNTCQRQIMEKAGLSTDPPIAQGRGVGLCSAKSIPKGPQGFVDPFYGRATCWPMLVDFET